MVRAKLLHTDSTKKNRPFRVKTTKTIIPEATNKLEKELINFIENTKELNIQHKYNKFEDLMKTKKTTGTAKEKKTVKWLTDETKEMLKTRVELISTTAKTRITRTKIREISKSIKLNMRKDRQRYRLEILERCIQKTGGTKRAIKQLKEKTDWIPNLYDKNMKHKTRRPEIMSIATNFFRELYSKKNYNKPNILAGGEEVPDIINA
ncbi:unnamed protein product [Arctia plantaginis]|uniref:Endonuclease-reverse transcriptase n=1 Tax=Arctia plantaginis TaxID=874455 RepID=A0A8S1BKA2_ARCPL|nr:unnamed protein product [Arctia plantaginis]